MRLTAAKVAVMRAVRRGHCDPVAIAINTGLDLEAIMGAAACLRGDGERPELLCCLDGEPWALTLEGQVLLSLIDYNLKRPRPRSARG